MGALPKKKVTKAKQGRNFIAYRLKQKSLSICPQCRTAKPPHRVCPKCGYYRGKAVVEVAETTAPARS
jgi:large subunit ribosomal protein L32